MHVRDPLKINWWLWGSITLPISILKWLRPHDVKGATYSDWTYLTSYLRQTHLHVNHDIWSFFVESMLWNVGPALLAGWLLQYFIVLAWERWHEKSAGARQP
jgi:hypothetical protein